MDVKVFKLQQELAQQPTTFLLVLCSTTVTSHTLFGTQIVKFSALEVSYRG